MLRLFWKIITGKIYWMLSINILSMFVVLYLVKGQWEWGQKKLLSPYIHHTLLMWFFNLPKTSSFARQKFQNPETLICFALVLSSLFGKKTQKIKLLQFFRWINEGGCLCHSDQTAEKSTIIPRMHLVTCDLQDPVWRRKEPEDF